ncbi:MAG: hypothetical protein ABH879_05565 [archaeon]
MGQTSLAIMKILERDPAIRRDLRRGLINTSALAKYMHNEEGIDASIDAIVTALRRILEDKSLLAHDAAIKKVLQNSKVSLRNQMGLILLKRNDAVVDLLPKIVSPDVTSDPIRLIKGSEAVEILVDTRNLDKIKEIFPEDHIKQVRDDLGVVIIDLDPSTVETPGVFAAVLNELAINSINIVEAISCSTEFLIFVSDKDLPSSYTAVSELCQ